MNTHRCVLAAAAGAWLVGCAAGPTPGEIDAKALKDIQSSFRDQGIAKIDRLNQDLAQQACSGDKPPSEAVADRIRSEALYSVKWPSGGNYIGDWRAGEKLAQDGRGMTWTDTSAEARDNGGNCYNCHQIDNKEISYGTIGPSLWNYGKTRGVTDVASPNSAPIVQYTWVKLWNARAYSACSNMPRFGHKGLLDEQQLRDLMALLLDPKSPVNQ